MICVHVHAILTYYNVCLEFTDIIKRVDAVGVIPELIYVHVHAVLTGAIIWLTGEPVCVVQGCPIAPYPVSLYPQQYISIHSTELASEHGPDIYKDTKP